MITLEGENLIFICSLPRSGSTLLGVLLGQHSAILAPPEPWFLLPLSRLKDAVDPGAAHGAEHANKATEEFLDETAFVEACRNFAVSAYNRHLAAVGKLILVDKTPRYYHALDFVDTLYPRAKKIWLRRNPLDVAASYKKSWGVSIDELAGGGAVTPDTIDFAHGLFRLAEYFAHESDKKAIIDYETLVTDPASVFRRLCAFLGVGFEPQMSTFAPDIQQLQALRDSSCGDRNILETQSVHHDSVAKWRTNLTSDEISLLLRLTGKNIVPRMGYDGTPAELRQVKIRLPKESKAATRREKLLWSEAVAASADQMRNPADRIVGAPPDHEFSQRWSLTNRLVSAAEWKRLAALAALSSQRADSVKILEGERGRLQAEGENARREAERVLGDSETHIQSLRQQLEKLAATAGDQTKFIKVLEKERDRLAAEAAEAQSETRRASADSQKHIDGLRAQLDRLAATSKQQAEHIAVLEKERDRLANEAATAGVETKRAVANGQKHTDALNAQLERTVAENQKTLEAKRGLRGYPMLMADPTLRRGSGMNRSSSFNP